MQVTKMGDKMSETIPEAPLPLFCANCGCPRQVRTRALLQDPDPAAKTRYTYLQTACPLRHRLPRLRHLPRTRST